MPKSLVRVKAKIRLRLSEAKKLDYVCLLIYPNEKKVIFNVTLQATLEEAVKLVRGVYSRGTRPFAFKCLMTSPNAFTLTASCL